MEHGLGLTSPRDRYQQDIDNELCDHHRMHGPADDPQREEIHDCSKVELPRVGPEAGEVGAPFGVCRRGGNHLVTHIRHYAFAIGGTRRHLGLAHNSAYHINRSIRCQPQETPSGRVKRAAHRRCGLSQGS